MYMLKHESIYKCECTEFMLFDVHPHGLYIVFVLYVCSRRPRNGDDARYERIQWSENGRAASF